MVDEKRTDEQILFPETTIAGIEIKPWSFGTLFEISTILEIVLDKVNEKNIIVDPLSGFISYFDMIRIFTLANSEVLKIISITTKTSEEKIRELSVEDGIKVAYAIWQGNFTILKNAISSLFPTVVEGAKEPEAQK